MSSAPAPVVYRDVLDGKSKEEHAAEMAAAYMSMLARRAAQARRERFVAQMRADTAQAFCA
jgi:hypothetical protein